MIWCCAVEGGVEGVGPFTARGAVSKWDRGVPQRQDFVVDGGGGGGGVDGGGVIVVGGCLYCCS